MKTKEIAKKIGLIATATAAGVSVLAGCLAGGELGGNIIMMGLLLAPGAGMAVKDEIIKAHKKDLKVKQAPKIRRKGCVENIDLGAKPSTLEIPEIRNGR